MPGHPRLCFIENTKTWMPATSAGMTSHELWPLVSALKHFRRGTRRARDQRLVRLRQRRAGIAEAVGDGIAAVAPEIAGSDLDAGRRLPPLVLGDVEQMIDPRHHRAVEPGLDDRRQR